ncbi:tail fiber assembly protein [Enterobacter cloacae]|uniref:tail fiber assembly protein n=1 Tax=Enterobacter cloacae TaxID=550 RepID=UPI0034D53DB4
MKCTGIFRPYEPVEKKLIDDAMFIKEHTGMDIIFLRTKEGELWHEVQYQFKTDTLKVCFDIDNIITMFSYDATLLNPINCAVAEIDSRKVPDGLNVLHEWVYVDGEIKLRVYSSEEYMEKAKSTKKELIANALSQISVIQLKLQSGRRLSESETEKLNVTLDYIDEVENIDISKAPNIQWPTSVDLL